MLEEDKFSSLLVYLLIEFAMRAEGFITYVRKRRTVCIYVATRAEGLVIYFYFFIKLDKNEQFYIMRVEGFVIYFYFFTKLDKCSKNIYSIDRKNDKNYKNYVE